MGVRSCCCGCSLRTGSLVIGYILAVLNGLVGGFCLVSGLFLEISTSHDDNVQGHVPERALAGVFLAVTAITSVGLAVHCMLICGIKKSKPAYVLPWIIFSGAGLALEPFSLVSGMVMLSNIPFEILVLALMAILLIFALQMYCIIVVSSFYHTMKQGSLLDEEELPM